MVHGDNACRLLTAFPGIGDDELVQYLRQSGSRVQPGVRRAGGTLTERFDLYLAAVVSAMFLAGCVLLILSARGRSRERKRWNRQPGS